MRRDGPVFIPALRQRSVQIGSGIQRDRNAVKHEFDRQLIVVRMAAISVLAVRAAPDREEHAVSADQVEPEVRVRQKLALVSGRRCVERKPVRLGWIFAGGQFVHDAREIGIASGPAIVYGMRWPGRNGQRVLARAGQLPYDGGIDRERVGSSSEVRATDKGADRRDDQ